MWRASPSGPSSRSSLLAAIVVVLPSIWFGDSPYTIVAGGEGSGLRLVRDRVQPHLRVHEPALPVRRRSRRYRRLSTAILADRSSLPIAAAIAVSAAIAAIVGGLLSWIAVRRSLGIIFTGIVTLVFSLAFANFLLGQRDLTGSESGLIVTAAPASLVDDQVGAYYLFAGVLVGLLIVFRALQAVRTSAGRSAACGTTRPRRSWPASTSRGTGSTRPPWARR